MRHFPIFVNLVGKTVVVSGAGPTAVPKIRLLLKTQATIKVFGTNPHPDVLLWQNTGEIFYTNRRLKESDIADATLIYGANNCHELDQKILEMGQNNGVLVNIVDNLALSEFITPAIVDRDPVTVAIGTEGTAPVLARKIKSQVEDLLPSDLGFIAAFSATFRSQVAKVLPANDVRHMWANFFSKIFNSELKPSSPEEIKYEVETSIGEVLTRSKQIVRFTLVECGQGSLAGLSRKARSLIENADVVLVADPVPKAIMEIARREADIVNLDQYAQHQSLSTIEIIRQHLQESQPGQSVIMIGSDLSSMQDSLNLVSGVQLSSKKVITLPSGTEVEFHSVGDQTIKKRHHKTLLHKSTHNQISPFADHTRALNQEKILPIEINPKKIWENV